MMRKDGKKQRARRPSRKQKQVIAAVLQNPDIGPTELSKVTDYNSPQNAHGALHSKTVQSELARVIQEYDLGKTRYVKELNAGLNGQKDQNKHIEYMRDLAKLNDIGQPKQETAQPVAQVMINLIQALDDGSKRGIIPGEAKPRPEGNLT